MPRDGSEVKNFGSFSIRPETDSQHLHGDSHPSIIPVAEDMMPSLASIGTV